MTATNTSVLVRLIPFVAMVFIGYLTVGIPLSALSLYVGGELGYGTVTVGWVIGIQSIATLLTRKLAADITDTRGTRTSVLVGISVILIASILYVVAAAMRGSPGLGLAVLLLGRIGLGIGESLMITGTLTWGIGTVGQAHAGKVMTWNGIAMYLAIAIGAPLGLLIMKAWSFMGVSIVMLALPVASFAVALTITPIALHAGKRLAFYTVLGRIWGPGLGLLLATVGFGAIGAFIALDYHTRGWSGAGFALTAFGAAYIAMRLVLGGLPDKMGGARAALIFLPIEVVGQVLLWAADSPGLAILGAALSGLGFSLVFPAFGIEAVKRVPPQSRGAALGGYVAFFDGALGATGPAAGVAAAAWGYPSVFLVGAVAAVAAFGIAFRESNHRPAAETQPGIT
jgi:MFS family permease